MGKRHPRKDNGVAQETITMNIPPKNSIVAYWLDRPTSKHELVCGRRWEDVHHYILLGPTGPKKVSYFARRIAGWLGKSEKVRLKLVVRDRGTLVTEDEYRRLHAEAFVVLDQQEMWDKLSR